MTYVATCTSYGVVKWRRQCLHLTLQLENQKLRKLIEAGHDDPSKDDVQKTEILISADGDFGEMKNTGTPSKRRTVGWHRFVHVDS